MIDLRGNHGRSAALDDAGFLGGDASEILAQIIGVIERDRRDDARERPVDHVGSVEAAAETDFKQENVGGMAREQQQTGRRGDFEHGDRRAAIPVLAFGQDGIQFGIRDKLPAAGGRETKAFVETHQMRRGIDVDAFAGSFENRPHEGDDRTFAVGAGDMNDRW